jgi:PKD repeat protein
MKKRLVLLGLVAVLGLSLVGCTTWLENILPIATIVVTDGVDKFSFEFDGSGSSDEDGTIETWGWTFGDGDTAYGDVVEHVYADYGTFIVTLTVTDNQGAVDSVTITVLIQGESPIASFSWHGPDIVHPHDVQTGDQIVFNGAGSHDVDGDIDRATWDFGDGWTNSGPWGGVTVVNHIYDEADIYTVTLTVTDEHDMVDTFTREISVGLCPAP